MLTKSLKYSLVVLSFFLTAQSAFALDGAGAANMPLSSPSTFGTPPSSYSHSADNNTQKGDQDKTVDTPQTEPNVVLKVGEETQKKIDKLFKHGDFSKFKEYKSKAWFNVSKGD